MMLCINLGKGKGVHVWMYMYDNKKSALTQDVLTKLGRVEVIMALLMC